MAHFAMFCAFCGLTYTFTKRRDFALAVVCALLAAFCLAGALQTKD